MLKYWRDFASFLMVAGMIAGGYHLHVQILDTKRQAENAYYSASAANDNAERAAQYAEDAGEYAKSADDQLTPDRYRYLRR